MPQLKHDRCLTCLHSEFGDLKQLDEHSGEPIGQCRLNSPSVVVLHFNAPKLMNLNGKVADPGGLQEIVTGAFPVVKASMWCRQWQAAE